MIKRYLTRGISILLSTMMVASFMPVQVFALDEYPKEGGETEYSHPDDWTEPVKVNPTQDIPEVTVTGGNISSTGAYNALDVTVSSGQEATVNVGDVNLGNDNAYAVKTKANDGSTSAIDVTVKSVTSKGVGIDVECNSGTTEINVTGDVESGDKIGIQAESYGIKTETRQGGTTQVNVTGNVKSGHLIGILAESHDGAKSTVTVKGDVYGGTYGVYGADYSFGQSGQNIVDITVEGTISGKKIGVETNQMKSKDKGVTVTAWAIKPVKIGEEEAVAGYYSSGNLVQATNFEKNNINYIIKVDETEGANLTPTGADVEDKDGLKVAKEGKTVILKVDLQEGYELLGAYSDKGKTVEMKKDADGNYYVVVPKGGGVYLSVIVNKKDIPAGNTTNIIKVEPVLTESSSNNVENNASLPVSIAQMIMNAAPGATVTVNILTGTSLSKEIVDMLEVRKDVTLVVNYGFNNGVYSATIPANTDLTQYKNAVGGIDFETLTTNFNGRQIY